MLAKNLEKHTFVFQVGYKRVTDQMDKYSNAQNYGVLSNCRTMPADIHQSIETTCALWLV